MKDHLFTDESLDLRGRTVRLRDGTVVSIPCDAYRGLEDGYDYIIYRWGGNNRAFQDLPGSFADSIYDVIEILPSSPAGNSREHLYTDESLDLRGYTVRLRGGRSDDGPIVTIPKHANRKMSRHRIFITYRWGSDSVAFQDLPHSAGRASRDVIEILSPPSDKSRKYSYTDVSLDLRGYTVRLPPLDINESSETILRLTLDRDRDLRGQTVLLRGDGDGDPAIVTIPADAERKERLGYISYIWPGGRAFQDLAGMWEPDVDKNDIVAVLESAPKKGAQAERDRRAEDAALARDAVLSLAAGVRLLNQPSMVTLGGLMAFDAEQMERFASWLEAEAEKI